MASPSYLPSHPPLKPLGFFHRCASQLDGRPIVLIFTGFRRKSANAKTGAMLQTWILREDLNPLWAQRCGADYSICGDCRQRPFVGGRCYVATARAPLTIYKAHLRGRYAPLELGDLSAFHGRILRIGSYGDPVAVPCEVWDDILADGRLAGHTGYSHSWRHPQAARFRDFVMASVDSPEELQEAHAAGWRCFRTRKPGEAVLPTERVCPASAEAGHKVTCSRCLACNGHRGDRVIMEHGFRVRKAVMS